VEIGACDILSLARRCGIRLAHARERLSVVAAGPEVAHHLGVDRHVPLVRLDRVVFAVTGEPLEWRVAMHRSRGGPP
jgi:DNA-binding GntR family transcriptional regulator